MRLEHRGDLVEQRVALRTNAGLGRVKVDLVCDLDLVPSDLDQRGKQGDRGLCELALPRRIGASAGAWSSAKMVSMRLPGSILPAYSSCRRFGELEPLSRFHELVMGAPLSSMT